MKSYVEWIIRRRWLVIALTLLVTALAGWQARHLRIVIDPNTMLPPSHPYVATGLEVSRVFGSKYIVVIGIAPRQGDVYQPAVLAKVDRIGQELLQAPGVIRNSLLSLGARRAKDIAGSADGLEVRPLMDGVPRDATALAKLRHAIAANPVYQDTLVARDGKATAIIVEFKEDAAGYRGILERVQPIVDRERDATVDIHVGGAPAFLAAIEGYSERMGILLPVAILVLALVLFEAFRSRQGLVLPLVTGILAVAWGVGVMGAAGIPMDVFNATTPILILAVATGHAVQMLKRYYDEYHALRGGLLPMEPPEANREAVSRAVQRVGPVMLAAGTVATLGFFSLVVFDISTVRTFGIFTGIGILATVLLEMSFIPALRAVLAPPREGDGQGSRRYSAWDRTTAAIANAVTGRRRRRICAAAALFALMCLAGMAQVTVDNSMKSYFSPRLPLIRDDQALNRFLGGTNTIFVLVKGASEDAIKEPRTLRAIDELQRFIESQPHVGKTVSIADFVKRMHQAMNGDNPAFDVVPASRELISQYLLLYAMSGEPGDFDTYVDYGYRLANVTVYLKSDSSADFQALVQRIQGFAAGRFGPDVRVSVGGGLAEGAALNEVMVKGKILNIVQIAAVVFVVSSLLFRSLAAGALVLLPLALAVLATFGLIGWAGIPLNVSTSLISAMAVGIGADYAIYLIYRIREELAAGNAPEPAIRRVLATAGKAILFVALAVSAGYGVLLLSIGFHIHQWLALLIAVAMLVSAVAALLLIPSLVLTLRPRFIFGEPAMKTIRPVATTATTATTAAAIALATTVALHATEAQASVDVQQVMERNAAVFKVADSVSDATFTLVNKSGQERVRKTASATKLQANGVDNMRLTRFTAPADVKDTVTLMIENSAKDDDIWVYLPALKKVRRLVASNKKDSFVGTDFSYADVIGYKVSEWNYKLLREDTLDGQPVYVVEALPKTAAVRSDTGYGRRTDWIRKDNLMTVKSELLDTGEQPLKTIVFSELRLVDAGRGKWQAMQMEASNVQTGHRTVIRVENFKANQNVKDELFTPRYMEGQ
ncbi:outer membrane lipoprotein-sorting protein [Ramlibacter sp. AN1133]|uniref:outer membrane lipoprotein-sorting protein n=1 Tax=Ramlibacter sp. AN1133 TaxID=3133429 RepID=UPI0030BF0DCA